MNDDLQSLAAHFDLRATRYSAKYSVAHPRHLYEHEKRERLMYARRWIARYAESQPAGNLLDVGCGDGRLVREVLGRHSAWRATGVDVSRSMICNAEQSSLSAGLDGRAAWQVGALQATSGTHDIVVSLGVVGYQHDQPEFLRALASRVRPGGLLIFTFANALSMPRRARTLMQSLRRFGQNRQSVVQFQTISPEVVDECLGAVGLQRVAARWLCFGLGLPHSGCEVAWSRWCEDHVQQSTLARRIAQVSLVCYRHTTHES